MKISTDVGKCLARVERTLRIDFNFLVQSIYCVIPVSMFVMIALFLIAINVCYHAFGKIYVNFNCEALLDVCLWIFFNMSQSQMASKLKIHISNYKQEFVTSLICLNMTIKLF